MSRTFEIDLDHSEGALLRVLGTVERRGFELLELNADKPDADSYSIRLRLDSERDPEVLCRQLERLIDVRAVRLLPERPSVVQVLPDPPRAMHLPPEASQDQLPPSFQATWL